MSGEAASQAALRVVLEYVDAGQVAVAASRGRSSVRPMQRGRSGVAAGFNSALHPRGAHGMFAASGGKRAQSARMPRSSAEIKAFQKSYGLPATGKLDAATRATIAAPPPETVEGQAARAAREKATEKAAKKRSSKGSESSREAAANKAAAARTGVEKGSTGQAWTGVLNLKEDLAPGKGMGKGEDQSPAVGLLQAKLQALGFDVGSAGADGKFGPATEVAVKVMQREYGLKPTGVVGSQTLQLLETLAKRSMMWQKRGIIEAPVVSGEPVGAVVRRVLGVFGACV